MTIKSDIVVFNRTAKTKRLCKVLVADTVKALKNFNKDTDVSTGDILMVPFVGSYRCKFTLNRSEGVLWKQYYEVINRIMEAEFTLM